MKRASLVTAVSVCLILAGHAGASVMFDTYMNKTQRGDQDPSVVLTGMNIADNTDRLLVVAVGTEYKETQGVNSVTAGNEAMTLLTSVSSADSGNQWQTHFFFLTQPATGSMDITANVTDTKGVHVHAWSLYGADVSAIDALGAGAFVVGTDNGTGKSTVETTLAGLPADTTVLDLLTVNGNALSAVTTVPAAKSTDGELYNTDSLGSVAGRYVAAAGDLTTGYSWTDGSTDAAYAAIAVVPEPATMTLLALGGLVALRRRRRA